MKKKKIKITYNGNPYRDKKMRFAKKKKTTNWPALLLLVVLAGVIFLVFDHKVQAYLNEQTNTFEVVRTFTQEQVDKIVTERLSLKVEGLQNEVLADLAKCESGGSKEPDGILLLDTNDEISIGRYQFQRPTVKHFMKSLFDKEVNNVEAIAIATDQEQATELAREILFTVDTGHRHWLNCSNKLDLKTRINLINSISE
jgi:hypothetical protein